MLIKITVENFKSFDSVAELSMIPSRRVTENPDHEIQVDNLHLLNRAVVYGANASGKTNLIDFFRFFKDTLNRGLPLWSIDAFCRNSKRNQNRESQFEIQFSVDGKFYAYGFTAVLSRHKIIDEWLYELQTEGASVIFQRSKDKINLGTDVKSISKYDTARFRTYVEDFEGNDSSLFLTDVSSKRFVKSSGLFVLCQVFSWLSEHIIVLTPNTSITDFQYYFNNESLRQVNKLIRTFDTGISEIKIKQISFDKLREMLPFPVFDDVKNKVEENIQMTKRGVKRIRMSMRSADDFFSIEIERGKPPKITTIRMDHDRSEFDFGFRDESDGTRRLFDLMDILLIKDKDFVFVVDELERSLHPQLTKHFLELFGEQHKNRTVQLLFTTHESSIMNLKYFRRDEIWFIDKKKNNASALYSLDRFEQIDDGDILSSYFNGRYGAVPVFQRLDRDKKYSDFGNER